MTNPDTVIIPSKLELLLADQEYREKFGETNPTDLPPYGLIKLWNEVHKLSPHLEP